MSPQPSSSPTLSRGRATAAVAGVAVLVLTTVLVGRQVMAGGTATGRAAPPEPPSLTASTFLGGQEWDEAFDVEVDDEGNRYVAGFTLSDDFLGDDSRAEGPGGIVDAFVVKVSRQNDLAWSVVLGGTLLDTATGLAVDDDGNVYVTGRTESEDFPTAKALQPEINGTECEGRPCHDAYVTKLDPDGAVVYSTYLGGTLNEEALGIAVDGEGSAYVAGNTDSLDLPTVSAFQDEFGSLPCPSDLPCELDTFVSKLSPDGGELAYSTYLGGGGSDTTAGLAVADDGTAFVTGTTRSANFPVKGGVQDAIAGEACGPPPGSPCPDAFVTALSPDGSSARYSTYLGGTEPEAASGIAVDDRGRAVITGATQSPDFPTARPLQAALANEGCTPEEPVEESCNDGFVTRLGPDGGELDFSTYLGGAAEDQGLGVAVDESGNVFVAGRTDSRDLPVRAPVQPELGGYIDGFAAALAAENGALVWSTFLGGAEADRANAVTVGTDGTVSVTGRTLSPDFPTRDPIQAELRDEDYDAFLTTLG
jgi:outer membrane protein assembly factor BamB